MTVGVGDYAQARFDFPAESSGDLGLAVGDVVKVTDSVDTNWLTGEKVCHDDPPPCGNFPSAFVERVSLPSVRTGQKVFLVLDDFLAEASGDLELTKGEIIVGTESVDESWWRGKSGPLKGIFPLSFVAELALDDGPRSRSFSARSSSLKSRSNSFGGLRSGSIGGYEGQTKAPDGVTKVTEPTFARALVDVSPQLDGELAFQLGDLVEITEIVDDDWFFGKCRHKEGLVSAMCVELLDEGGGEEEKVEHGKHFDQHFPPPQPPPRENDRLLEDLTGKVSGGGESCANDAVSGRNASAGSYTSENTWSHDAQISPYGRVLFTFESQASSELSLEEGQIVTLLRHLGEGWTEGELDGRRGIFPTSFVEIVVDCPRSTETISDGLPSRAMGSSGEMGCGKTTGGQGNRSRVGEKGRSRSLSQEPIREEDDGDLALHEEDKFTKGSVGISAGISEVLEVSSESEIGLVLHTFVGEVEGDVSVTEGETVEVVSVADENWLKVKIEGGHTGLVPRNHIEVIGLWTKEDSGNTGSKVKDSVRKSNIQSENSRQTNGGSFSSSGKQDGCSTYSLSVDIPASNLPCFSPTHRLPKPSSDKSISSSGESASSSAGQLSPRRHSGPVPPRPNLPPKPLLKVKPLSVSAGSKRSEVSTAHTSPGTSMQRAASLDTSPSSVRTDHPKHCRPAPQLSRGVSLDTPGPMPPARPPALITAKPFSSLPRSKPHHVISPNERRLSMSTLDSIVEGEMEKAKSRSGSQASSDSSGSSSGQTSKGGSNTAPPVSNAIASSLAALSYAKSAITQHNLTQPTSGSPNPQHPLSSSAQAYKRSASFFQNNSANISKVKSHLASSMSMSDDQKPSNNHPVTPLAANTRPRSTSLDVENLSASFVNKAFEMDVDEGKLVDLLSATSSKPKRPVSYHAPSTQAPTSQPVIPLTSLLSKKVRAAPSRPQGPRIAPAPSKVPLVPDRAAPTPADQPKIVPRRPAPKAPVIGSESSKSKGNSGDSIRNRTNNNSNGHTNKNTNSNTSSSSLQSLTSSNNPRNTNTDSTLEALEPQLTASIAPLPLLGPAPSALRPAPAPPTKQPYRPVSMATPHSAVLPRPADLISFSPEKDDEGLPDTSEETKKELARDLKSKLEANKADIELLGSVTTAELIIQPKGNM